MSASNNKRIAKNTLVLYIRMFFNMVVSLYTSRVVLYTLGVSDFGIINVVGGVVAMLSCLNGSFSSSSSRFITYELGKPDFGNITKVFSASMTIHIGLALILFILLETIGLYLVLNKLVIPEGRTTAAIIVYQLSIVTCMVNITQVPYSATIIAHEKMDIYAYVSIVEVLLKLTVVYLLVISPIDKLVFYALLLCILQVLIAIIYRLYCMKKFSYIRFHLYRDKDILKPMLGFSGWDMYGTVSTILSGQSINVIQNTFWGTLVNAAIGVSESVKNSVLGFTNNFLLASKPQIVKCYASGNIKEMENLAINTGRFSFLLLFLFSCPLILECEYVMKLWLVEVPEYAVIFCQLSLVYSLVSVMFQPCIQCIHAVGKMKLVSFITGTLFYIMIPSAYILLKIGYGPIVPYCSNIVIISVISVVYLIILDKYVPSFSKRNYLYGVCFKALLIASISSIIPIVIHIFMPVSFYRLLYVSIVSCFILSVCTFYIGMSKDMRARILQFIINKMKKNLR